MTARDLKNALLQEAVQGKLVPQIASEGNARNLLNEIRKEKSKLIKEGKLKKEKPLPELTEEEIPFDIPENWCWCNLGELGLYRKGPFGSSLTKSMFVPKSNDSIKVYEQKNAIQKDYTLGEYYISKNKFETMQSFIVEPSDIIVSCAGTIGEVYKLPNDAPIGIINQALMRVKLFNDNLSSFWMMYFDYVLKKEASKQGAGTAIKNIPPFEILKAYPFPLPPLAEQKRIVAAIEKFMPLIDEYGKKETELKAFNEQIGILTKKAILQEAVQGKLVPQIAAEGTAKDLLEEIKKEKTKLIKEGKLKKEKPLPEIKDDEIPFDIPESWCWCRWGDLSYSIQYGYNASAKDKGRIKMVRISDIHENEVIWDSVPYCDIKEDEIKTYLLKENDILFARTGGTVGKSFLVKNIPCEAIYAGYLIRTHYDTKNLIPEFLKFFMESDLYWSQLREGTIATAQPNCNGQTLSKMIIPLPPLAEQKRIVATIEKLLPLCEKLGN